MPDIAGNELIKVNVFEKVGLAEGMNVGDLGCGNLGYFSVPAAKIVGKKGVVYAVDILKSVLQSVEHIAKQEGLDNIKTVWSNLEVVGATKIPSASLDLVMLINMLFQSEDDRKVFLESHRLAKAGGKLVVIDWKMISSPFGPDISKRIKTAETIKFAQEAGFNLVEEFEAGPYHFGLIFVK
ncbi:MAG: methyltransferase domain-containing protein [Candidatus Buchananbacteria bacterium]|nr:methyltransferase domain-containing protein [Candidatus Buchananbacteria bacterium]